MAEKSPKGKIDKKTKTQKQEVKLTPFEQELLDATKKIREYKLACEANIVATLYQNPEHMLNYDLKLEDFSNNIWKVYFATANGLYNIEKKTVLDEITVNLYLDKHTKLKEKFNEYGGYAVIENATAYIKQENIDGYVKDLKKWNVVLKLLKNKFPVADRLSELSDMTADEIYQEYEARLNHLFVNVDHDVESYNLCEGINDVIDKLNKGIAVGLPLYNAPILSHTIGGCLEGNITLMGALSGMGKSLTTLQWLLPSILENNEKLVIMINEEDVLRWKSELLIWTCNNIYKKDIPKYIVRKGSYDEETMATLRQAAKWIEDQKDRKNIIIIPFKSYKCSTAIKIIKKFASLNFKYFILDTFKVSDDAKTNEKMWESMMQDVIKLYDTIKPASKNVHLWMTFQLGKQSTKQRHYSQDNTGNAKNIVDVASTCIMYRKVLSDEYEGEKRELHCWKLGGKSNKTQIPFRLKKGKEYAIIFIVKNRAGATDAYQVVVENDLSKNVYTECGFTNVPLDW